MNAAAILRTQRLDLEPVSVTHAGEAWPLLDDERMWRYYPALRPATLDDLRALYRKWESGSPYAEQIWLNWMCRARSGGALVGAAQATVFPQQRAAFLAYSVYPAHQRNGYAREATRAVIDHVARTWRAQRFFAEMNTANEPSYKLAESLGFTRVETHEAVERGHGIAADEYLYELVIQ